MAGSGTAHLRAPGEALLRVENLVVEFKSGRGKVHAVSDVSFDVVEGETLGVVGESGCGKSTAGRAVMQLTAPGAHTAGSVTFDGTDVAGMKGAALRALRPRMQLIFQDPISSLNPRRKIKDIVAEPLAIAGQKEGRDEKVTEMLTTVGLPPEAADRRPFEMSGGQCQRVSIARALIQDPKVLICDEPVSALDVSVQAQILNLLEDMKARYGLTMVFISHDLSVVKNISDRVLVMYLGKVCEVGPAEDLYRTPRHPYTAALLSSIPSPDPDELARRQLRLGGELPSPLDPPSGCRFRTRCPRAQEICAAEEPVITGVDDAHFVACHFPLDPVSATVNLAEAAEPTR